MHSGLRRLTRRTCSASARRWADWRPASGPIWWRSRKPRSQCSKRGSPDGSPDRISPDEVIFEAGAATPESITRRSPMAGQEQSPPGPDLTKGVSLADIAAGQMLLGHVEQDAVLLARQGDEFFAIGATCSHYSGPLAEGLMAGDTVRCPWHHARFCLRTGEAIGAPAFNTLPCWRVEKRDDKVFVRERTAAADRRAPSKRAQGDAKPERIVIVGGG